MDREKLKEAVRKICAEVKNRCDGCPIYPFVVNKSQPCTELVDTKKKVIELVVECYQYDLNGITAEEGPLAPETRREILQAAERCVCGDRDQDYGGPEDSFALIARLWEPIIKARCVGPGADVCVDAVTVALCMAELKIARAATNETHMDSWVDLAGYAACGGEIASHDKSI